MLNPASSGDPLTNVTEIYTKRTFARTLYNEILNSYKFALRCLYITLLAGTCMTDSFVRGGGGQGCGFIDTSITS